MSKDCPPELLSLCSTYPYWPIVAKVASNPRCAASVVENLAKHPHMEVRLSVLLNLPKCSRAAVEMMLSDEQFAVRRRACEVRRHYSWLVSQRQK